MDNANLFALAKAAAKTSVNPSYTFSFDDKKFGADEINAQFRDELNKLSPKGDLYTWNNNKNLIFQLMATNINEVLPQKVLQAYGQFADVQTFAQGDKPIFNVRISEASKKRAKQFVTRVGLAGRYEVFQLDGYSFEVKTSAHGGAAYIPFEQFLDGKIQMSDVYDIVLEGLDEDIYKEIAKSLIAMVSDIKTVNKSVQSTFNENEMDKLLATTSAYGTPTIYCTYEFATQMKPDATWASDSMKQTYWENGYFTTYKGTRVIVLPQSFTDIDNTTKVIDPSYAYIIPTGAEKPVKVAFEGQAQVREVESQEDWSRVIQTYQKVGVSSYLVNPGICVYKNESLHIENK